MAGGDNRSFDWLDLTWSGEQPTGTAVSFETRSGTRADPNHPNWSIWQAVDANNVIASPDNPYFQYRALLSTTNSDVTPVVEEVLINATRENVNQIPVLDEIDDQTVVEETLLTFTANASDMDLPANALTYSLVNAPAGATIGATNGEFTWTPNEVQGPGDYIVTVRVSDNGTPSRSDEQEVLITVAEVNQAPVLNDIGDQTVAEETLLAFTASASDIDLPANALTYSLVNAPAGASIGAANGQFAWTPNEAQGPGDYIVTVRVSDNGTPSLSDEQAVQLTVTEVNQAPVLSEIDDQTVAEGTLLAFTAVATDKDLPANALTYSLINAPAGATIGATNGEFTWTPNEAQGPGDYIVTVRVSDNGTPSLSDEQAVQLTVTEVNQAPVLSEIDDQTVAEGTLLAFTAVATDKDLPANALTYTLVDAPAGASIGATNGQFAWIPTEAQGPGIYIITVRVRDNGTPSLSDEQAVQLTVTEVNHAPILSEIGDQSDAVGSSVELRVSAQDPENNTLTFSATDLPTGLSINQSTGGIAGIISLEAALRSPYRVTITVSDGLGETDSESFVWTVNDEHTLTLNVIGNGIVIKEPNQTTYHFGDFVTITAAALNGWVFERWQGDFIDTDASISITIQGNTTINAFFDEDPFVPQNDFKLALPLIQGGTKPD